jgi:hypothetical protein
MMTWNVTLLAHTAEGLEGDDNNNQTSQLVVSFSSRLDNINIQLYTYTHLTMAMSWEKKGRKSPALSLSQLNSRWRCIASIRFIGPWWMSPCVISLRLYLGPSSFLFTLLVCVCVYVCDGERDSGGPKDLNERDTTSQIHQWPCVALSLSRLCVGVECFVVVVVSGPFKSRSHHHAPPNKIIIAHT